MTEDFLQSQMVKYGPVKLINLPKKEDGSLKGYGFITFETMQDAQKAIEEISSKETKLMGAKISADWCLPQNIYLKSLSKIIIQIKRKNDLISN